MDKPANPAFTLYFSFELLPGQDIPTVKLYVPIWRYLRSDDETIRNLEAVLRMCHHPWGEDGTYGKIFRDALYVYSLFEMSSLPTWH